MSDEDIIIPDKRKSKNDKRAKARYNVYKKGGHTRVQKKKDETKNE